MDQSKITRKKSQYICDEPNCENDTAKNAKCSKHRHRPLCLSDGCSNIQRFRWRNVGIRGLCRNHFVEIIKELDLTSK